MVSVLPILCSRARQTRHTLCPWWLDIVILDMDLTTTALTCRHICIWPLLCAIILMASPHAPSTSATSTAQSTTAILHMASSITATKPHTWLPRHQHKGLPHCLSNLVCFHSRDNFCNSWTMIAGDISALVYNLYVHLQFHHLHHSLLTARGC